MTTIKYCESNLRKTKTLNFRLQNELFIKDGNTTIIRCAAKLEEGWRVGLAFSMSRLIAPITPDENGLRLPEKGYIGGFLETIQLGFFAFSFAVAIKNRIKR